MILAPSAAFGHAAFGNLGPFYAQLLHPLADPVQGLVLVGAALFLARQPLGTAQYAVAALAICGLGFTVFFSAIRMADPDMRIMAGLAAILGLLCIAGLRLPVMLCVALAAAAGMVAATAFDTPDESQGLVIWVLGGAAGIALMTLLVWAAANWAQNHIHPVAPAVVGAWVTAISIMMLALPA